jgi:hypothetical protein
MLCHVVAIAFGPFQESAIIERDPGVKGGVPTIYIRRRHLRQFHHLQDHRGILIYLSYRLGHPNTLAGEQGKRSGFRKERCRRRNTALVKNP